MLRKRSTRYNNYLGIIIYIVSTAFLAGGAFQFHYIIGIVLFILSLVVATLFISKINRFGELKKGLSHPNIYGAGMLFLVTMSSYVGILFPHITAVLPALICLGGIILFVWVLNKEALKNIENSSEEEV